jgi:SSS family transporter
MSDFHLTISSWDVLVLVAYLAGSIGLGFWVGRGQRDLSDYMLGGRDLPWWAVLGSIVSTETSAVTFLSIPGLAYGGNLTFLQLPLGYLIGRLLVVALFLPHYFRGEMFSAYEVLSRRFGGGVRQVASLLFLTTRTLADGLRLYLIALVVTTATGLDVWLSVVAVGLTTIVYTVFGGIKSVVWTDCLQFVTYLAGAVVAAIVLLGKLPGGWHEFVDFAVQNNKLQVINTSFDPTQKFTLWAGVIGGMFLAMATHGADQLMVQRYLCARSQRDAARALALSGVVILLQFALFLMIGVGLAYFYSRFPPGVSFESNDQVFAAFIVDYLPKGVVGLTLAAIFAAAITSSPNSSATAFLNDLYLPLTKTELTPARQLWLGRVLSAVFGAAQIAVGITAHQLRLTQSVVDSVLAIAGFTTGIILGVFFLGILSKRATQRGALVGLVVGIGVMSAIFIGTKLAWPWYTIVGSSTTFVTGLAASLLWPDRIGEPETTGAAPIPNEA